MTVVDRFEILLLKKRGDQIVILCLAGMFGLVVDALDLLAGGAAVVDTD